MREALREPLREAHCMFVERAPSRRFALHALCLGAAASLGPYGPALFRVRHVAPTAIEPASARDDVRAARLPVLAAASPRLSRAMLPLLAFEKLLQRPRSKQRVLGMP